MTPAPAPTFQHPAKGALPLLGSFARLGDVSLWLGAMRMAFTDVVLADFDGGIAVYDAR